MAPQESCLPATVRVRKRRKAARKKQLNQRLKEWRDSLKFRTPTEWSKKYRKQKMLM